jgi:D-glycero-D-manno-heptose 1,7-bisphosphate phosphatase
MNRNNSFPTPAVFLDKDGTLIDDLPYNVDPARIQFAPGAAHGADLLARAGYALVVVSNQSGVARGMFAEEALTAVERRVRELLADFGVPLAGFYYCPHHPAGVVPHYSQSCNCRKPQPGMLLQAANDLNLLLHESWLVGDILDDVEAGNRAGCRTALIDNGHESQWKWNPRRRPDVVAEDLAAAARAILAASTPFVPALESMA